MTQFPCRKWIVSIAENEIVCYKFDNWTSLETNKPNEYQIEILASTCYMDSWNQNEKSNLNSVKELQMIMFNVDSHTANCQTKIKCSTKKKTNETHSLQRSIYTNSSEFISIHFNCIFSKGGRQYIQWKVFSLLSTK